MEELKKSQADERRGAQIDAMRMGGDEMSRSWGLSQDARSRATGEYEKSRNSAFDDMARVLSARGGVNNPQMQAVDNPTFQSPDVAGAAGSYAGINNAWRINQADNANAWRIANANRGGRGGGGGGGRGGGGAPSGFDINNDPSYQRWLAQQEYARSNQPKQPGFGQQLFGAIAPGLAAGFGQGIGSYFSGGK